MDFNILGEQKRYIQMGTVMTDKNYRNQGLSKFLIEYILNEWKEKCDLIYLFANSTVLDFYPKLGFTRIKEYEFFKKTKSKETNFKKLNMDVQIDREKLYDYARNTQVFGKLSMQENADLVMFYCISIFKECVYYLEFLDVIAIAKVYHNQLHLLDVFSKKNVDLDDIINALCDNHIDSVLLGFTPKNCISYEAREINEVLKDEVLFVQNSKTSLFDNNQLMFPLLSHA